MSEFKSAAILEQLKTGIKSLPADEKASLLKKVNGIFELVLKNTQGTEQTWTLDIKNKGEILSGKSSEKADVVLNCRYALHSKI